ncbi:phospholipase D-like domain-containing protein [Citrobacter sp. Ct235]|uniref:phospholipase D-like domain-containing protein n=1 Tax=Citrobacter sp. Ct235 TaxID=2985157 RepID=UPI00257816FD|nr:phospholipase D-like domain-containing protein [Citrobacter sp. Ct235]MDM2737566.1 phospholipase D-like domain-containing protein [Citrobacter sp. Ct235]
MSGYTCYATDNGFHFKLWRGERMVLLGFDVDEPEPDFVGFAIKVCPPNSKDYTYLKNRIAFDYTDAKVTGDRLFDTNIAPLQKFRWIHFPWQPVAGIYRYQATKMHMEPDGSLREGITLETSIELSPVTYDDIVDIGFTRNFASSQAYRDQFNNNADIIPGQDEDGLNFKLRDEVKNNRGETVYDWLGFEAKTLIDTFIQEVLDNPELRLDFMAYDLNLPDLVEKLEAIGPRLRAVIDDSSKKDKETGILEGHGAKNSSESVASERLAVAGAQVTRTRFFNLQHHKVLIQRDKQNQAVKVLCGSTNFSFRGLYIQANNVLVFHSSGVAASFGQMFDEAFTEPNAFRHSPLSQSIQTIKHANGPTINVSYSPHRATSLSLDPVVNAINQASSSVFYSIAFLNNMRESPVGVALAELLNRPVFSYGTVNTAGKLQVVKPDGTLAVADFAYLAKKAPEPFRAEWAGGKGINIHHKFVVTDFNLASAKVFTGSSNLAPSGEKNNGDHLIMIEDQKIATAYVIEAIRVFDHLQFRQRMQGAGDVQVLKLLKPTAITGQPAWFTRFYIADSQAQNDRLLFSH